MRTGLLIALFVGVAAPSVAQEPKPLAPPPLVRVTNATPDQVRADALELARLAQPEPLVLKVGMEGFRLGVEAGMKQDANFVELEKAHPGLTKAILDETSAVVEAHFRADLPNFYRRYALFYQERLTPAEIKEITAYLRVPAGQRLVAAKFGNIDLDSMVDEMILDPQAEVSADQMRRTNRIATARTVRQTSKEDQQVMLKMLSMPTLKKMGEVGTELSRFEADIANEPDPVLDKKVEQAMERVFKRFKIGI